MPANLPDFLDVKILAEIRGQIEARGLYVPEGYLGFDERCLVTHVEEIEKWLTAHNVVFERLLGTYISTGSHGTYILYDGERWSKEKIKDFLK